MEGDPARNERTEELKNPERFAQDGFGECDEFWPVPECMR